MIDYENEMTGMINDDIVVRDSLFAIDINKQTLSTGTAIKVYDDNDFGLFTVITTGGLEIYHKTDEQLTLLYASTGMSVNLKYCDLKYDKYGNIFISLIHTNGYQYVYYLKYTEDTKSFGTLVTADHFSSSSAGWQQFANLEAKVDYDSHRDEFLIIINGQNTSSDYGTLYDNRETIILRYVRNDDGSNVVYSDRILLDDIGFGHSRYNCFKNVNLALEPEPIRGVKNTSSYDRITKRLHVLTTHSINYYPDTRMQNTLYSIDLENKEIVGSKMLKDVADLFVGNDPIHMFTLKYSSNIILISNSTSITIDKDYNRISGERTLSEHDMTGIAVNRANGDMLVSDYYKVSLRDINGVRKHYYETSNEKTTAMFFLNKPDTHGPSELAPVSILSVEDKEPRVYNFATNDAPAGVYQKLTVSLGTTLENVKTDPYETFDTVTDSEKFNYRMNLTDEWTTIPVDGLPGNAYVKLTVGGLSDVIKAINVVNERM